MITAFVLATPYNARTWLLGWVNGKKTSVIHVCPWPKGVSPYRNPVGPGHVLGGQLFEVKPKQAYFAFSKYIRLE